MHFEVASSGVIYIPNFMKILSAVLELHVCRWASREITPSRNYVVKDLITLVQRPTSQVIQSVIGIIDCTKLKIASLGYRPVV